MSKHSSPFTPKVCSCCGAPLNEDNICSYCGVSHKRQIAALDSFEAFMRVVNRHRPYEPSDFVKESFIPDHF